MVAVLEASPLRRESLLAPLVEEVAEEVAVGTPFSQIPSINATVTVIITVVANSSCGEEQMSWMHAQVAAWAALPTCTYM